MTTTPVPPGTAENLARIRHFRDLLTGADGIDAPDAHELDAVAAFLIGDVGGRLETEAVWSEIRDDCRALWHLVTDDWCTEDLDELSEAEWARSFFATAEHEIDRRYEVTRERLADEIEQTIRLARYSAAEARKTTRTAVAS